MAEPQNPKSERPWRQNTGIVVINDDGLVLAGERIHYPGVFQLPQGGIDPGETALQAAYRELYEEVGLRLDSPPLLEVPEKLYYEFPEDIPEHLKKYRGQCQSWFFFRWNGDPAALKLDLHEREFSRVAWLDLVELAGQIVHFKKPIYERLCEYARTLKAD